MTRLRLIGPGEIAVQDRAGGFGRRFALLIDVAAVVYYDSEPFGLLSFGLGLPGLRRSVQLFESDC